MKNRGGKFQFKEKYEACLKFEKIEFLQSCFSLCIPRQSRGMHRDYYLIVTLMPLMLAPFESLAVKLPATMEKSAAVTVVPAATS